MSRAAAAAAAVLILASTGVASAAPAAVPVAAAAPPHSVANEPLFVDIVARAGKLKAKVQSYRNPALKSASAAAQLDGFDSFKAEVGELAALDMQGHVHLAKTGEDGDLKCILKGISQDLPLKLKDVAAAKTGAAQDSALRDIFYLLRDNVEVITTPAKPGSIAGQPNA